MNAQIRSNAKSRVTCFSPGQADVYQTPSPLPGVFVPPTEDLHVSAASAGARSSVSMICSDPRRPKPATIPLIYTFFPFVIPPKFLKMLLCLLCLRPGVTYFRTWGNGSRAWPHTWWSGTGGDRRGGAPLSAFLAASHTLIRFSYWLRFTVRALHQRLRILKSRERLQARALLWCSRAIATRRLILFTVGVCEHVIVVRSVLVRGHSIAPKTTSANAASASP